MRTGRSLHSSRKLLVILHFPSSPSPELPQSDKHFLVMASALRLWVKERSSHRLRLKCPRCRRPHAQATAHGTSTRGYEHWHRSGFRQKRASSESRASSPHTRKIARGHKRSLVSRDRMICYTSVTMVVSELAPTEKSRCSNRVTGCSPLCGC